MIRVFLIAGEASGDQLGAGLMAGLSELTSVSFTGVGGPEMQRHGLQSIFPMDELSIMGLIEVLPRLMHLRKRLRQTVDAVVVENPDILITIDSPDFCLRLARRVRQHAPHIRIVHYVAPSVWAWRPGRAKKMAAYVDQVLALLPFEPEIFEKSGIQCDFVGHPVTQRPLAPAQMVSEFQAVHGLKDNPILLLLPGSRKAEISRLLPVFYNVCQQVKQQHPRMKFIILPAKSVQNQVIEQIGQWNFPVITIRQEQISDREMAMQAAGLALMASGSISLELAMAGTPMVVAYDMAWLSRTIIKHLLQVDTVTLVNLITQTRTVPEFLGARCRADLITNEVLKQLSQPDLQLESLQKAVLALTHYDKTQSPDLAAAKAVLRGLGAR